ncbi:Zinc-responsive transcriptional regulator ZAP1 [Cytospora mali]|uniref:Zinc-responsive transcriptional regulator ZAP1 n=1 Tax=Cytospora mali TaxID=578113 RepID=A0A194UQL9_CYTMA|nr:Zinc-responsive transcriptional regulator ZAP1 [Valsa mali var. pyri (nom. inval.)]
MDDLALHSGPFGNAAGHEDAAHDDGCLTGIGCQRLGLDPRYSRSGTFFDGIPFTAFPGFGGQNSTSHPLLGVGDFLGREDDTVNLHSSLQPPKLTDADPTIPNPTPMLSEITPSQPPDQEKCCARAEDDVESLGESEVSCDSQCTGSQGPCSAGTCDEATACRDQNCTRPAVELDVAHSAFILQTMTSGRDLGVVNGPQPHITSTLGQTTGPQDHTHNTNGGGDKGHDVFMNYFPLWMHDLAQHHIGQKADHDHDGCAFGVADLGPISHCHAPALPASSLQDGMAMFPDNVNGDGSHECGAAIYSADDLILHVQQHYQQQPPPFQQQQAFQQQQYLEQFSDYTDLSHHFLMENLTGFPQVNGTMTSAGVQDCAVDDPNHSYSHGVYTEDLPPTSSPHCQKDFNKHAFRLSTPGIIKGVKGSAVCAEVIPTPGSTSVSEVDMQDCNRKSCLWHDPKDGLCGRIFQDEEELEKHVQTDHVDKMAKTSEVVQGILREGFFCPWHGCNRKGESKPFEQRSKIRRHMVSHTGHKPHVCDWPDCGHRFSAKQALSQHMLIHRDEKPLECHECGMLFRQKSALTMHIRTHTKAKPLKCNICGKSFSESSNLSKHRRTHDPER